MKTIQFTLALTAAVLSFSSCQKQSLPADQQPEENKKQKVSLNRPTIPFTISEAGAPAGHCDPNTVQLTAGQYIDAGTVSVTNDDEYIYVTYRTANGYRLTETHLYVGDCEAIPVTQDGNARPGRFPFKGTHNNASCVTYRLPISVIGMYNCGCIAAHAVVKKIGDNGQVLDEQTAWGSGCQINPGGSWAMKFAFCPCSGAA